MIVTITLTTAGVDTGPFNLYSDVDGYVSAFETGVAKIDLVAGYTTSLVPDGTTTVRVISNNVVCNNFIDIVIGGECTTTTTTSTSSTTTTTTSSTTTTTTSTSTTTTTTTTEPPVDCTYYSVTPDPIYGSISLEYFDCVGNFITNTFMSQNNICAETGTVNITGGDGSVSPLGPC